MTDPQRFDTWLKCRNGVHKVLIGTRSAVLTPFADLGVIVVDEEHDGSFKQQEGLRYSARDVAVKRGQMLSIPVILGSATPSLESLENARRERYQHLRLPHRVAGSSMPAYRVVDIRGERLEGWDQPALAAGYPRPSRRRQPGARVHQSTRLRAGAALFEMLLAGAMRPLRRQAHLPPATASVALPPLRPSPTCATGLSRLWRA